MRSSYARRTSALIAGGLLVVAAVGAPVAHAEEQPAERGASAPLSAKGEGVGDQTAADLDGGVTAEEVVQALVGEGVTVDDVQFTGNPVAAGLAGGFDSVFGVPGGVVLSSGSVAGERSSILGPNLAIDRTTELGVPGDADLEPLAAFPTNDATVLEFDFVPETAQISFDYIFGSEEYNEWVGSEFNDVFAFFVNGENCAVVGEDAQPVSVNTVNADSNADLFVDNEGAEHETELDGFTSILSCVADVEAGATNHVKLAIADASDATLDSTVLIAAGTSEANHPPVADDQAVETVAGSPVDITLTGSDEDDDAITFAVASEPVNGTLSGEAPDLTYTPNEGFTGEDTFTFTVSDDAAVSEPATVTVGVTEEPTPTPTPTPSPSPSGEPLPDTGAGALPPVAAAVLLAAAGIALVLGRRRPTAG